MELKASTFSGLPSLISFLILVIRSLYYFGSSPTLSSNHFFASLRQILSFSLFFRICIFMLYLSLQPLWNFEQCPPNQTGFSKEAGHNLHLYCFVDYAFFFTFFVILFLDTFLIDFACFLLFQSLGTTLNTFFEGCIKSLSEGSASDSLTWLADVSEANDWVFSTTSLQLNS